MEDNKIYDVIIIGGGPAGLTAGIYAARSRLKSLLIDNYGIDSQLVSADIIENYPGFPGGLKGIDFLEKLKLQAAKFRLAMVSEEVEAITEEKQQLKIKTPDTVYPALSLIIATSGRPKHLNVKGESELKGRGVSYCATCDGPLFRNKTVAVVGGGNTAIEEVLFLTNFAEKVFVVHRREQLRAAKILQERVSSNTKVGFILNSKVVEIGGDRKVENILIENVKTAQRLAVNCDGVFVSVGFTPNTEFLKDTVKLDENGNIITDEEMATDKTGIFAAGDCRKKSLRQITTACGDGAIAASSAEKYISKLKGTEYL